MQLWLKLADRLKSLFALSTSVQVYILSHVHFFHEPFSTTENWGRGWAWMT